MPVRSASRTDSSGGELGLWQTERLPYNVAVKILVAAFFSCVVALHAESPRVAPPPAGKLYHGFYWGGVGTDSHDPTEHDVTAADVVRYEQAVGSKTVWVYFSNN